MLGCRVNVSTRCLVPKETFRTLDLPLTRRLLCQLSYMGMKLVSTAGIEPAAYRLSSECSTTELRKHEIGGGDRNRTCYILVANQALCQMSYTPEMVAGFPPANTNAQLRSPVRE